jgi:hypothetical protein
MKQVEEYKIIDWAYNRMFHHKTFKCMYEAWDFIMENCQEDEDENGDFAQDIFVVPVNTRCYANGYWSSSN